MATPATDSRKTRAPKPGTKDQWAKLAVHTITCPSGMVVKARIPDLTRLLKNDLLPERLRAIGLKKAYEEAGLATSDTEADAAPKSAEVADKERYEDAKQMAALLDWLVIDMVIDPKLEQDDIDTIPAEDREMLVGIAQREIFTDAAGAAIGVMPLSMWDSFRREHHCPEGCEACEALQREFSTREP
jgi:hypothetical protein